MTSSLRLSQLEPQFIRYEERDGHIYHVYVDTLPEAQGIWFLCPKCFLANAGPIGTHGGVCWSESRGTPPQAQPGPGRWKLEGTSYQDLTVNADPPRTARSIALTSGCGWHGFITNGEVTDA